jgi:superoxide dismutase
LDKIKSVGSQAEALLKNRELGIFVHQFKFDRLDTLGEINGHTAEDNQLRVAISNQIAGLDEFVKSLKRAVYFRDRVVSQQANAVPDSTLEE